MSKVELKAHNLGRKLAYGTGKRCSDRRAGHITNIQFLIVASTV